MDVVQHVMLSCMGGRGREREGKSEIYGVGEDG
jgi:hypothetical protein